MPLRQKVPVPPLCCGGVAIGVGCDMSLYIVQLPPHMLGWTAWLLVKESNGRSGSMLSYWRHHSPFIMCSPLVNFEVYIRMQFIFTQLVTVIYYIATGRERARASKETAAS